MNRTRTPSWWFRSSATLFDSACPRGDRFSCDIQLRKRGTRERCSRRYFSTQAVQWSAVELTDSRRTRNYGCGDLLCHETEDALKDGSARYTRCTVLCTLLYCGRNSRHFQA